MKLYSKAEMMDEAIMYSTSTTKSKSNRQIHTAPYT